MRGPEIIARSISALRIPDQYGNEWQYHSRSDRHSKIACWAVLFDLLQHSPLLRHHATVGKVGFGINHEFSDFNTRRKKNLDLVVCTPNRSELPRIKRGKSSGVVLATFGDMVPEYGVLLSEKDRAALVELPALHIVAAGSVCLALEAKAAMTEHIKALPRLHDELDSSHSTIHGHSDNTVAAALVMINFAMSFVSPGRNKHALSTHDTIVNLHQQPKSTERTIQKVTEIRRRSRSGDVGFDAIGVMVVDFRNDQSPCRVVTNAPALPPSDPLHYDQMIERVCAQYQARFSAL